MNEEYITRKEHEIFEAKIEAEDKRQNKRIDVLEETVKQIQDLTISVKEMTVSINNMAATLERQVNRLDAIEKEPAENWKKAVWIVLSALIGAAVGALLRGGIAS
ncbi:MAG: hypothetical protein K6G83_10865 [Lachnospiraceae bacterium]|nr:hypothetical protein [Lachnospiraceae bacterium]